METVRDLAIIILALETIVLLSAILFLVWQGWKLVGFVKRQVGGVGESTSQVLDSAKQTARTAQGTATFMSDRAARPVIEMYSTISGALRFAQAAFRPRRNREEGGDHERS